MKNAHAPRNWKIHGKTVVCDPADPIVCGIVNMTGDSFYAGSRFGSDSMRAVRRAADMVAIGAKMLDIGAESTRPGSAPVPAEEQISRLGDLLPAVVSLGVPVSVDTSEPDVMKFALDNGVSIINDVRAFTMPGAVEAVAKSDCGLIVMNMGTTSSHSVEETSYKRAFDVVSHSLKARTDELAAAGIDPERIVVDPGFGFGKRSGDNVAILAGIGRIANACGRPVLAGLSRKTFIGDLTGKPVDERLAGSIAGALISVINGASIVRVHDVAETVDAIAVWKSVKGE